LLKPVAQRLVTAALAVGVTALVAGCLSGNPSYFPYLLPSGEAIRTHPKPPGPGYFADFDPYACRIEVRPDACMAPVRGAQVFIATVYDGAGLPRRKRRVEWMIEGPGSIVEVDESGYTKGRGMKVDNKYAFSHTDFLEHCITRGNDDPSDDFTIGPGQTWCVVTSAVEGETTVIAYAPGIADWDKNRAYAKIVWGEGGRLLFPPPVTARAGGEYTLSTRVTDAAEGGAAYRIRYRIIDGPPAALHSTRGGPVNSVTEAVTTVGPDGSARVTIAQPAAAAGTNRVAIEVVKPDPDDPEKFAVVSRGETRVKWQAPELSVKVHAPKALALNQEVPVTYAVAGDAPTDGTSVTVTATIPPEMELVRTEPKAVVDGNQLIWTLPGTGADRPQSVEAVYRPLRVGSADLAADVRTSDGQSSHGSVPVQVTAAKLLLRLEGPRTAMVGDTLPFKVVVSNVGDGPAEQVRVQARTDEGADGADKSSKLDETIATLPAGKSRTIDLPVSARHGGNLTVEALAAGAGNLVALPQAATVDVREAGLAVSVHGPGRGYIGQEVSWKIVVRNVGDVPLGKVMLRATLPAEVKFVRATDGGRVSGKQVDWDLGTAPARQDRSVELTAVCEKLTRQTALSANATAAPVVERDGPVRTASTAKSIAPDRPAQASFEIIGIPALQMSIKDANDPVGVGQRTTYTIRVKNAGTLAATRVEVAAEVPGLMIPVRATGPGTRATITGRSVTFPAVESLAPNAEATFVVEVEGAMPGDARFRAEARSVLLAQPLRAEEPTRVLGKESRPPNP
jgi:uncharacterized repeat protein (TIGR01451 family)